MTDWADEAALRVAGSPTDIAIALRTERELARQAIMRLEADLAATRRVAIDRLKTIKGLNKRVGVR